MDKTLTPEDVSGITRAVKLLDDAGVMSCFVQINKSVHMNYKNVLSAALASGVDVGIALRGSISYPWQVEARIDGVLFFGLLDVDELRECGYEPTGVGDEIRHIKQVEEVET